MCVCGHDKVVACYLKYMNLKSLVFIRGSLDIGGAGKNFGTSAAKY